MLIVDLPLLVRQVMAETKGFEPSRRFLAYSLSRGAPSTTRPRLRRCVYSHTLPIHKRFFEETSVGLHSFTMGSFMADP